jgi:hypothetical protein
LLGRIEVFEESAALAWFLGEQGGGRFVQVDEERGRHEFRIQGTAFLDARLIFFRTRLRAINFQHTLVCLGNRTLPFGWVHRLLVSPVLELCSLVLKFQAARFPRG